MKITLGIHAVDGEHFYELQTKEVEAALKQLNSYDHEGSSISLKIEADNEDAYKILNVLMEAK